MFIELCHLNENYYFLYIYMSIYFIIIYLQWNTSDTTTFPTRKYKILFHATRVIFFRITILHVLPNLQDKSQRLAANS